MKGQSGFTLIELVSVIVILAIIAAFSTQFIVTSLDSYYAGKRSNDLVNKGRTSLEQISRYLRSSVPNSTRVSASGNCLEVMPSVGGAFYDGQVADSENGAASISNISTSPFSLRLGNAEYAIVGALDSSDIYSSSLPSALTSLSSTVGDPIETLNFDLPHRFIRNSISQRVYIGDNPVRFCVSGGDLLLYENFGLITSSLTDTNPGGVSVLMASNVEAIGSAFVVSSGAENRSASVDLSLQFSDESLQLSLQQTVHIRNVP